MRMFMVVISSRLAYGYQWLAVGHVVTDAHVYTLNGARNGRADR
ncbi:unnamed protein product, partial [marine sediment metagenome]